MPKTTTSIGKVIYNRRSELGITQKEVADFVGVSEATVSRWESGHIDNMRRDRIAALSKILKISPLVIMGIDENEQSTDTQNESMLLTKDTEIKHMEKYRDLDDTQKKMIDVQIDALNKMDNN